MHLKEQKNQVLEIIFLSVQDLHGRNRKYLLQNIKEVLNKHHIYD